MTIVRIAVIVFMYLIIMITPVAVHEGETADKVKKQYRKGRALTAVVPRQFAAVLWNVEILKAMADYEALRHGLHPRYVRAIAETESQWNVLALSRAGAMGIMQITPIVIDELGIHNPLCPAQNIMAGVQYIRLLAEMFDGNLSKVAAAYNAGPSRVLRIGAIPDIRETVRFVKKVLAMFHNRELVTYYTDCRVFVN
jgi:soluble lytic murein transglycosylase-like protein